MNAVTQTPQTTEDTWSVAGRTFRSRLIIGTGKYKDYALNAAAAEASGAEIVTARSARRAHHVVALWSVELAAELRAALVGRGVRRVESFTSGRKTIQVDWPVGDYDPFFNVNTPEDLARAEAIVIASVALSR